VRVRSRTFGQKLHQIALFKQNHIIMKYLAKIYYFPLLGKNCTFSPASKPASNQESKQSIKQAIRAQAKNK